MQVNRKFKDANWKWEINHWCSKSTLSTKSTYCFVFILKGSSRGIRHGGFVLNSDHLKKIIQCPPYRSLWFSKSLVARFTYDFRRRKCTSCVNRGAYSSVIPVEATCKSLTDKFWSGRTKDYNHFALTTMASVSEEDLRRSIKCKNTSYFILLNFCLWDIAYSGVSFQ